MLITAMTLGLEVFPNLGISYFFKDVLHLDPAALAFFNSIINFVWLLKPIYGFISDTFPICGSRRRGYFLLFSITSILGWLSMTFLVAEIAGAIIAKICINVSTSFCNVIGEGVMVESS